MKPKLKDRMSYRQKIAFEAPCARAHETSEPEFRRIQRLRGAVVSTILTVNK